MGSKFETDNEASPGSVDSILKKKLSPREGWGHNGVEYLLRNV